MTAQQIGERPAQDLAGDRPKNQRVTNPKTGGWPAQELANELNLAFLPARSVVQPCPEWEPTSQPAALPLSTQLLWFEGKPVPITRPQDHYIEYFLCKGTAPIFITMPLKKREAFMNDAEEAAPPGLSSEATVVLKRLEVYKFGSKVPKPARQIPQCVCCFASFVFMGGAAWQQSL